MIKKLTFFGCSITGGNELFEEAHVPNYKSLSFDDARKVAKSFPKADIDAYNYKCSFPAKVAEQLGVDFENFGSPGMSNKEIACRAISHFTEDHYEEGNIVILQFTTHNRFWVKYKETETDKIVGSFVVHPTIFDDRLTKTQNNLLKEMFFEFYNESMLAIDDTLFMYYAADALRAKGIPTYIIWCDIDIVDWAFFDIKTGVDKTKKVCIKSDKEPQFGDGLSQHFASKHHNYNVLGTTLKDLVPPNSQLPRYHFNHEAHKIVAAHIAEKIKCLHG